MGGELYGRHKNNLPKTGELNGRHEKTRQGMENQIVSMKITCPRIEQYKITHQIDGCVESEMVSTKITLQRMENQIVSMKITRPRVGQYKNYSPKGWMGGELHDWHEKSLAKG